MKLKKVITYLIIGTFILGLLSSCAIDKKCPAYSQIPLENSNLPA